MANLFGLHPCEGMAVEFVPSGKNGSGWLFVERLEEILKSMEELIRSRMIMRARHSLEAHQSPEVASVFVLWPKE